MGVAHPQTLKSCRLAGQKRLVQCTSAGQLIGHGTIGELLLPEKAPHTKNVPRATSHPPKFNEVTSLGLF